MYSEGHLHQFLHTLDSQLFNGILPIDLLQLKETGLRHVTYDPLRIIIIENLDLTIKALNKVKNFGDVYHKITINFNMIKF